MKTTDDRQAIDERAQRLFKMLVELYLAEGTPVASRTLAAQPGVDLSSATVRNIMADLESRGLVVSPHTSAGKMPTTQGLRLFVDTMLAVEPLDEQSVARLQIELNPDLSPAQLVENASHLLSRITRMAGIVTLPRRELVSLRHVEFLPLSDRRVLVILVVNEREVQNRVIHTAREYTETELVQAANFINRRFAGESMYAVRHALLESMQQDKNRMDQLMQAAIDVASKAFEVENHELGYIVAGETHLLESETRLDTVRELFEAFSRKRDILHLLDRCLASDGVQLFIGDESGYRVLDDYSLVTAPYQIKGTVAGVLAVIGPTRMYYQRVIPIVDVTARVLGAAMNYEYGSHPPAPSLTR
jgi:heat-inducible transcriptional repressor